MKKSAINIILIGLFLRLILFIWEEDIMGQRDRRQRALLQQQNFQNFQNFHFLFYLGWSGCFTQIKRIIMKVVQS